MSQQTIVTFPQQETTISLTPTEVAINVAGTGPQGPPGAGGGGGGSLESFYAGKTTNHEITWQLLPVTSWQTPNFSDANFSWDAALGELTLLTDGNYLVIGETALKADVGAGRTEIETSINIDATTFDDSLREEYVRGNYGGSTTASIIVTRTGSDRVIRLEAENSEGVGPVQVRRATITAIKLT